MYALNPLTVDDVSTMRRPESDPSPSMHLINCLAPCINSISAVTINDPGGATGTESDTTGLTQG